MSTESGQRGDGSISSTPPFEASFMWTSPSPYRSRFHVPAYLAASPPHADRSGSSTVRIPTPRSIDVLPDNRVSLTLPGLSLRRRNRQSREDHVGRRTRSLKRCGLQSAGQTVPAVIDPAVCPFIHQGVALVIQQVSQQGRL